MGGVGNRWCPSTWLAASDFLWSVLFYRCSSAWGLGGCVDPGCVVDDVTVWAEVAGRSGHGPWASVGLPIVAVLRLVLSLWAGLHKENNSPNPEFFQPAIVRRSGMLETFS